MDKTVISGLCWFASDW